MDNVHIAELYCKGCGYCIQFCPKKVLEMGTVRNKKGHFFPVVADPDSCIACGICATMCPEAALAVTKNK